MRPLQTVFQWHVLVPGQSSLCSHICNIEVASRSGMWFICWWDPNALCLVLSHRQYLHLPHLWYWELCSFLESCKVIPLKIPWENNALFGNCPTSPHISVHLWGLPEELPMYSVCFSGTLKFPPPSAHNRHVLAHCTWRVHKVVDFMLVCAHFG